MANGYSLLYDLALVPEEPHPLQLCCLAALACWNTWDSPETLLLHWCSLPCSCSCSLSSLTVLVAQVGNISTSVASEPPLFFPRDTSRSLQGQRPSLILSGPACVLAVGNTFRLLLACLPLLQPEVIPGFALSCRFSLLTAFNIYVTSRCLAFDSSTVHVLGFSRSGDLVSFLEVADTHVWMKAEAGRCLSQLTPKAMCCPGTVTSALALFAPHVLWG